MNFWKKYPYEGNPEKLAPYLLPFNYISEIFNIGTFNILEPETIVRNKNFNEDKNQWQDEQMTPIAYENSPLCIAYNTQTPMGEN